MVTPHITAQALHTTAHYRTSLYRHPRIGDALDMNRCLTFQPLRFVFTSQCVSRCVSWHPTYSCLSRPACLCVCLINHLSSGSSSPEAKPCGSSAVYCPRGSGAPQKANPGFYTEGGADSTRRPQQTLCPVGHYCIGGVKIVCPAGKYGLSVGLSSAHCSGSCQMGFYCPAASTRPAQKACPGGSYGDRAGLGSAAECTTPCASGYTCDAASTSTYMDPEEFRLA